MAPKTRDDGRSVDALRPVSIEFGTQRNPEGSVLYRQGHTTVLVSVSVEDGVPTWMANKGRGWLTAEYAMHPRANPERRGRDGRRGRIDGRTAEIQRLVGRALRAALVFEKLGERTIHVDCDVLDADGGTRTASITGGFAALAVALDSLRRRGLVAPGVLRQPLAAVSVGYVDERPLLDLCYREDAAADVDLNVVATADGSLIEVQGTAEGVPLPRDKFDSMMELAVSGVRTLAEQACEALKQAEIPWERLVAS